VPGVFISYSRRDKPFVGRLHDALRARDYDVWVDWEDIPPSAEWFEEIRSGVRAADGFVYVISPDSVASGVCGRELDEAVAQHKRIVPVVHRELPKTAVVPAQASALEWVFLRDDDEFEVGLEQLVSALETDLDHVRTHTWLGEAAARWESRGHDRSQLLRGSELARAEAWLVAGAGKQPQATQLQRQFLLSSRQAASRRHATIIGAISIALAVAVGLAVFGLVQRSIAVHERVVALIRQLDASAQSLYGSDPELSVLLAARAAQETPDAATVSVLRVALTKSHIRYRYALASKQAGDVVWSPDGTRLLVTSPDVGGASWARIYTPGSPAPPISMPGPSIRGASGWDARGNRVVIGSGSPAVYDARTGRLIARLPGPALDAALSPDGRRLVTVDADSTGHVFSVATGRQLAAFAPRLRGGPTCFALSPDGTIAAQCDSQSLTGPAAGVGGALDTWDTRTGRQLDSVRSRSLIPSVAWSPDSRRYVFTQLTLSNPRSGKSAQALARAQGADGTFVYDARAERREVIAFPGAATAAAFSPNPAYPAVAYATVDDLGHVYSFLSHINVSLSGAGDVVDSIRFGPGGGYLVLASRDDQARVYQAVGGGSPTEVLAGDSGELLDAGFGRGDTLIATTSDDGTARVWAGPLPQPAAGIALPGAGIGAGSLGYTAGGDRILQIGQDALGQGRGHLVDARTLRVVSSFVAPAGQAFVGAATSRTGGLVVALSGPRNPKTGRIDPTEAESYDARSAHLIAPMIPGGGAGPIGGVLGASGSQLVTIGPGAVTQEWNPRTGSLLRRLPGTGRAGAVALSPDGLALAVVRYPPLFSFADSSAGQGPITINLYDAPSGRLDRTITGPPMTPESPGEALYAPLTVAISPGDRLVAVSGSDSAVRVYDTAGALVAKLPIAGLSGGSFVSSLAFSPDGTRLAAGATSGAYLWRIPSFERLPVFQHVTQGISSSFVSATGAVRVGFSSDSTELMTSGDATLEAWNVADHLQLFRAYPVVQGALSPDGNSLVTAAGGLIETYPCDLCGGLRRLLSMARRDTTRALTPAERSLYLGQG
jgi:WD40 repeat protein